jgi:hypothetical protein
VEEMISIRRSEYEPLLLQQEELRTIVRQLREKTGLLKNGRNSKTSSIALSQDISRSNFKNKQYVFFALKCLANIQITNSARAVI